MGSINNIPTEKSNTSFNESDQELGKTQQIIKLKKEVYVNKTTNDFIDRAFSEFFKTENAITIDKFFDMYQYLFYKIIKEGKISHYSLIRKSKAYIDNYFDPLDEEIEKLLAKIERLEIIHFEKQNAKSEEHLFYPNRTFIKSSVTNPSGLPIWVMQDGVKRLIKNYDTFKTLKRCFGHTYDTPDNMVVEELEASTLDDIWDGPDIASDKDINKQEFDAVNLEFNLNDLVEPGYIKAKITCLEGVSDPTGFAPKYNHYEPRHDECYYGVLAYNLGSDNEDAYGNLADQYADNTGPGEPRVSTTNLAPGSSHTRHFRKQSKWHWTLDRVVGHVGVEVIEDSNRAELGCCGVPHTKTSGAGSEWRDEGGNVVRKYFDLPGWPIDLKWEGTTDFGTKSVQDLTRATDMSRWLPYAWHGKEMPMNFDSWDGGTPSTKDLKWRVLGNADNVYYDDSRDWVSYMKTIRPTFMPIEGLGKYGGVYGMPIVTIANSWKSSYHSILGSYRNVGILYDSNKKVFGGRYHSRYVVPLGVEPFGLNGFGGNSLGGVYWFLPVDKRWTGEVRPFGIDSHHMYHYTSGQAFGRNEKFAKIAWLAYPGFDNWGHVAWSSSGSQFSGKGNRKSLI